MFTRKDFYLLDAIDEKIALFKSAGLIDLWRYRGQDSKQTKTNLPKVLKLYQLTGCFYVLIFGSFISFCVFLLEVLVRVGRHCLKRT